MNWIQIMKYYVFHWSVLFNFLKKYKWVWTFVFHRYNSCTQITIRKYFLGDYGNCFRISFFCLIFFGVVFVPFFVFRLLLDPIYLFYCYFIIEQFAWVFTPFFWNWKHTMWFSIKLVKISEYFWTVNMTQLEKIYKSKDSLKKDMQLA